MNIVIINNEYLMNCFVICYFVIVIKKMDFHKWYKDVDAETKVGSVERR